MNRYYFNMLFSFVIYLVLQVVLFRNIAVFDLAFCFVYVAVILLIPIERGRIFVMFSAFIVGLLVDLFYNSLGIHAASAVLLAFLRYLWISALTPLGGYDSNISPSIVNMGAQWFATYALPLIFIHHFALFFIEAGGFSYFGHTLLKVFF